MTTTGEVRSQRVTLYKSFQSTEQNIYRLGASLAAKQHCHQSMKAVCTIKQKLVI